jgi:hypothetical protein
VALIAIEERWNLPALTAAVKALPQIPSRTNRQAAYSGFDPMTDLALATFG